ncbi:MAG: hypothetical protein LBG63_02370 [Candidatus Methanoplasma sp.]|jgi:DNA polymerase II small subunit/DNA polymerase delta subunit B|nr:hypothetical protein [Candidatus Methanoplasma sp.]
MKIFDHYSLLCFSIAFIILLTVFISAEEPEDKEIIGVVYDIRTTQNGYTFSIEDTNGETIRCFFRNELSEYGIYSIEGTFSEDRSMLFVNSVRTVGQNEF